ncbi:MAG: site-specific integrase [Planctomycetota bacterium]
MARAGPAWRGISGEDRYWLYRFLIESCMRPKSVRALTVGDFVLETEPPHVRVAAATHKTGRPELQNRFQGLESTDPAFRIPPPWNQAVMLRYDLERAGIAYASPPTADCPRGEQVDLYSLKHTGASLIADVVRSPRELAALVGTTARIAERHYVHLPEIDQIGERLEQLPSLSENLE